MILSLLAQTAMAGQGPSYALTPAAQALIILFLFALGACIGSFLNVVVWRLPRNESLVSPPSHCPRCEHRLAWYDNIPVFGWIFLRGRCRYCHEPISIRYPIVEFITGVLFVFYYLMIDWFHFGPCRLVLDMQGDVIGMRHLGPLLMDHPWLFGLYLLMIAALLAASLIDAELFIIPLGIPWLMAVAGVAVHALTDRPQTPGALSVTGWVAALSFGAAVGLLISYLLWLFHWMPVSFPQGEPMLEEEREEYEQELRQAEENGGGRGSNGGMLDYARPPEYGAGRIRFEISKELVFLIPPLLLGLIAVLLYTHVGSIARRWDLLIHAHAWIGGFLGALFGGMIGGGLVWITRILGTLGFGRVAMGMGDVHLMFGIGAILGAGPAAVIFFLAPFFGLLVAIYMLLTGARRELPYGPYLSLAAGFVLLFYCPIAAYLTPGAQGLMIILHNLAG